MQYTELEKMYRLEEDHWWFKAKRDLVLRMFKKYCKKGILLDVGCGTGMDLVALSKFTKVVGCDNSHEALEFAAKRGTFTLVHGEAEDLPFENNWFDTVTALDMLEHSGNDKKSIENFYNVLKVGGVLILTVPAHQFLWTKHDTMMSHKKRYDLYEIKEKIQNSGFKIEVITYWNCLLFPFIALYKLFNKNKSHIHQSSKLINYILFKIIQFDNYLVEWLDLPGISIVCVARKI